MESTRRLRVLVAGDDPNRSIMVRAIREHVDTLEVHDGFAALALARRESPDAIVADLALASLNGIGLSAALRRDATLTHTPVLIVGARDAEEVSRAIAAGADDCFDEPIPPERLLARIHALARRSGRERELAAENRRLEDTLRDGGRAGMRPSTHGLVRTLREVLAVAVSSSERLAAALPDGTALRRLAEDVSVSSRRATDVAEQLVASTTGGAPDRARQHDSTPTPPAAAPVDAGTDASPALILLVDDEPGVRAIGKKVLEREGYRVMLAASGEEALAISRDRTLAIDLLVTDVVMPVMRGSELASAIRRDRIGLPVLYISGYTGDAAVHHGIARGEHFLAKPFGPADLAQKVREIMRTPSASAVR